VEGRGTSDWLARVPLDLSSLTNLNRMANTPDPRDFYRVSRAVLVPSLRRESLGRVPMEALANGIPVLASDRGALPETLGDAGFAFTIPERCGPTTLEIPTARDVDPWAAVLEKLWNGIRIRSRESISSRLMQESRFSVPDTFVFPIPPGRPGWATTRVYPTREATQPTENGAINCRVASTKTERSTVGKR